jgi:hypothetical protein
MRKFLKAAAIAACLTSPVLAQDEAATPQGIAVDLFTAANTYARDGDYEAAKRMLEATDAIKPGHPAVLRGLLRIALRAEQTDDAFDVLDRIANAGMTFDTSDAAEALQAADAPRFQAVNARLTANGSPTGRAERIAVINRPDALIEGVAMDIETERLFLSSVAQREILMMEPFDRNRVEVFADASDGLWSVFGVAVDDRTRMVWAASGVVPQTPMEEGEEAGTALFAFDLMSGELFRRYTIEGAVQISDFVVRDGAVYASDSRAPRIYVLDDISGELRVLVEDERFVNLQGVALARGALYVADYGMGIWRVDLGDQSVTLVRPAAESLIGIDGLLNTRDGRIIAVRNGVAPHQVMAIDLDADGRRIEAVEVLLRGHRDMGGNTEPTLIDLADQRGWLVANAAWPLFPEDGSEPETTRPATVILEMDLR